MAHDFNGRVTDAEMWAAAVTNGDVWEAQLARARKVYAVYWKVAAALALVAGVIAIVGGEAKFFIPAILSTLTIAVVVFGFLWLAMWSWRTVRKVADVGRHVVASRTGIAPAAVHRPPMNDYQQIAREGVRDDDGSGYRGVEF